MPCRDCSTDRASAGKSWRKQHPNGCVIEKILTTAQALLVRISLLKVSVRATRVLPLKASSWVKDVNTRSLSVQPLFTDSPIRQKAVEGLRLSSSSPDPSLTVWRSHPLVMRGETKKPPPQLILVSHGGGRNMISYSSLLSYVIRVPPYLPSKYPAGIVPLPDIQILLQFQPYYSIYRLTTVRR